MIDATYKILQYLDTKFDSSLDRFPGTFGPEHPSSDFFTYLVFQGRDSNQPYINQDTIRIRYYCSNFETLQRILTTLQDSLELEPELDGLFYNDELSTFTQTDDDEDAYLFRLLQTSVVVMDNGQNLFIDNSEFYFAVASIVIRYVTVIPED